MIPDLYIFWKICEWFLPVQKITGKMLVVSQGLLVTWQYHGTFWDFLYVYCYDILCVFGNFCAVVRVFWMVVRALLEYYSWLLTGLKGPLQIFVIFWSLHWGVPPSKNFFFSDCQVKTVCLILNYHSFCINSSALVPKFNNQGYEFVEIDSPKYKQQ